MSKTALNRASRCCHVRFLGTIVAQILLISNSSNKRYASSCSLHQQSFWLLIFDWIEQVLLPVLCCHLSVLLMVVCCSAHLQQGLCLQKIFCASKRLVLLTLHDLQRPAKFSMCCGGTVTETAYLPLRNVLCFHFNDKVHKHVLSLQAPTPHWGIAKPYHGKWGWRKDQGQRLSVLAGCSIASTARRKLISIHKNHKICTRHTVRTQLY